MSGEAWGLGLPVWSLGSRLQGGRQILTSLVSNPSAYAVLCAGFTVDPSGGEER
ncbi:hypothetical protein I79_020431 [Cricetulus griseus]|uniref:Uncharacterized protein n=1 Tax=Cricetulus griseus TaxID=10029 RepID=G3IA16_CRIGR|nr:hypothetical protein I79_020431 [Cricetulus griseus]